MAQKLNQSQALLKMDHKTLLEQNTVDYVNLDDKLFIASAVAEAQPKPPKRKKPTDDSLEHERER